MIEVRSALPEDCRDIFEWRNDSHTREMSHNTQAAEWDAHQIWFGESLKSKKRCLLICTTKDGEKVGVVRFDVARNHAEVSINLSPNARGKGLAKLCLGQAIQFAKEAYPELDVLRAEIKPINTASKKIFLGVGFEFEFEEDAVEHYKMPL